MPSDLHCSLGSRSFVDPVSNWALIAGVELNRDLAGMIQGGKYPQRCFSDFIHESVHHWTFYTPVGATLALLQFRARRRAFLIAVGEPEIGTDEFSIIEDLVRYESAIALLRPFAEGLALFAEFDDVPRDSPTISLPMLMASASFTQPEDAKDAGASPTAQLEHLLLRHRLNSAFIERKGSLLAQPLTASGGGYLAGYLTVKNLWQALSKKAPKLRDPDLFLAYAKSFFYDDGAFVSVLTDPDTSVSRSTSSTDCVDAISRYFQRRFAEMLLQTNDEALAAFEAGLLKDNAETVLPGDDKWHKAQALGHARIQTLVDELREGGETLDYAIRNSDLWMLVQRSLMCIGSFRAPIAVGDHGRVGVGVYDDKTFGFPIPVFNLAGLKGIAAQSGDGSLEIFLAPSGRYSLISVTLGSTLVAATSLSPTVTAELADQFTHYRTSLQNGLAEREMMNGIIDDVIGKGSTAAYRQLYQANIDQIADEFYVDKALSLATEEDVPALRARMKTNGFYALLNDDEELVRDLARLSLASASVPIETFVDEVFNASKRNLSGALTTLAAAERAHGLRLVLVYPAGPPPSTDRVIESLV